MDPDRENWLEAALYIAKTEEIQKRAAAIDSKLKAALDDFEAEATPLEPESSSQDSQKIVIEDADVSDPSTSDLEVTPVEPPYEQVLILIWQ
ncbi:hypothetical protein ACN4EK_11660 [Pantanalinema rosaneae CENA516]|uniref:hypothetical protein n=1 Tax=Pantanalinema rosaneae TaxID=1620701 RepID=UPI003D6DD496